MDVTILHSGPSRKAVVETYYLDEKGVKEPVGETVYSITDSISFELHRDFKTTGRHVIMSVNRPRDARGVPSMGGASLHFPSIAGRYLQAPFNSDLFDSENLLDEQKIRIASVEELTSGGRNIVRVGFVAADPAHQNASGEVDFLPDRCWAIQRCDASVVANVSQVAGSSGFLVKSAMTVEYGGDQGGIPIPKRVRFAGTLGDSTFDFDEVKLGVTTPEREFALQSYGLPDPTKPLADPARSYLTYWLLGFAALALVAAYVIRKKLR